MAVKLDSNSFKLLQSLDVLARRVFRAEVGKRDTYDSEAHREKIDFLATLIGVFDLFLIKI